MRLVSYSKSVLLIEGYEHIHLSFPLTDIFATDNADIPITTKVWIIQVQGESLIQNSCRRKRKTLTSGLVMHDFFEIFLNLQSYCFPERTARRKKALWVQIMIQSLIIHRLELHQCLLFYLTYVLFFTTYDELTELTTNR